MSLNCSVLLSVGQTYGVLAVFRALRAAALRLRVLADFRARVFFARVRLALVAALLRALPVRAAIVGSPVLVFRCARFISRPSVSA